MDILLIVFAFLLLVAGIAGCILPMLPGVPLAYAGMLLLHLTDKIHFTTHQLIIWLIVVIVLQVVDYITPLLGSKYSGGTSFGNRGCMAGTLLGMFFMPWGVIVGPFIGAVAGEMMGGHDLPHAIRSGIGTLLGFLFGTLLKVIVCFYFLVQGISVLI
jgi:uncharacterized protein YqgC (DUF456 family)